MLPMLGNRFVVPTLFEPWSDLRREIDRVFDSALTGLPVATRGQSQYLPAMDVEETSDKIRLTLEVPGVSPEDLEIAVENNMLTVSGEKRFRRESGKNAEGSHMIERRYGRFERTVMLPETVDADSITAHFENGVLTVELPKSARSRRRTISVGLGADQHRRNGQQEIETKAESREQKAVTA
ncbi:MAG TPA: Hsp20/alpha crystallin family protein [Gemmatimonadaceae bacterium]|nr:Hsp20/alpha crystallin family protein [Gemmatimonadaceae bacterium]